MAGLSEANSFGTTEMKITSCSPHNDWGPFLHPLPLHCTPVLVSLSLLCNIALWWLGGLQIDLQLTALFDDRPDLILSMITVDSTR